MTATWTDIPAVNSPEDTADLPLPAPRAFGAPVLIGDCASPLAGETVLSLLWRRMEQSQSDK